ncbi:MAG: MFS transporter [Candidatus Nezhaarchaeota archaeon]|nr:MFS transporter [Candidatus Nezhaarchaeota archaeon]
MKQATRIKVLISGLTVMFIAYAIRYDFGALLPSMMEDFGLVELKLGGLIFTSYFIAYTVFSPIMGGLSDKLTARPVVIASCAIMGLSAIALSAARNLLEACICYGAVGLGASGTWTSVSAAVQRWFERKRRGLALGIMVTGICLGFGVATYVTPYIIGGYGWRFCWLLLGLTSLAIAVFTSQMFGERQHIEKTREGPSSGRIYLNRNVWLMGISYFLIGFAILVPFTYLPSYSIREASLPEHASIWLISLMALGGVAGALGISTLSDRLGERRDMIFVSNSLTAIASAVAVVTDYPALVASAILFGLSYGSIWPLYSSCASEYFGEVNAGKVVGFWTFFLGLGSILSPLISGAVADAYNTLKVTFALNTAVAASSMLPLLFVKRKAEK